MATPTRIVEEPQAGASVPSSSLSPQQSVHAAAAAPSKWSGLWAAARPHVAVVVLVLVARVAVILAAWVAEWLFTTEKVKPEFTLNQWKHWDALQFIAIAEHGYVDHVANGNSTAFFPLLPLLMRGGMELGFDAVTAGMIFATIGTIVAAVYLRLLAVFHGYDGFNTVAYLLTFPTAVFLVAPYTEPLFLAGAIPAYYYAQRGRAWPAAGFLSIAIASRTVGVLVLVGVALILAYRAWPSWRRPPQWGRLAHAVVAMMVATVPLWAYCTCLHFFHGSFFRFMRAQKNGWGREFVGFEQAFWATWNTWDSDYSANVIFTWRMEIVAAAICLLLLGWLMAKRHFGYAVYVGGTLVVALGNAWYYSTPRLALAFFPFCFLVAAVVGRNPRRHTAALLVLFSVSMAGVVAYTRGNWYF